MCSGRCDDCSPLCPRLSRAFPPSLFDVGRTWMAGTSPAMAARELVADLNRLPVLTAVIVPNALLFDVAVRAVHGVTGQVGGFDARRWRGRRDVNRRRGI